MNAAVSIFATCTALAGYVLGATVQYFFMARSRRALRIELEARLQERYDEGWQAHRTHLLRTMHDANRTHVPHDEENPRPITVRHNALHVRRLPKLPGRN